MFSEALAILLACGHPSDRTLIFLLLTGEKFALANAHSGLSDFLGELLCYASIEIAKNLDLDAEDLRPRWLRGTAKLLARTFQQHVTELSWRGDAIGDHFAAGGRM